MSKKDYTKFTKTNDERESNAEQFIEKPNKEESYDASIGDEFYEDMVTIQPNECPHTYGHIGGKESTIKPTVTGVVVNCERLNVRRNPRKDAPIVCAIDKNSEVEIDEDGSNQYFYKICTASGVEGFCVKDYISVIK